MIRILIIITFFLSSQNAFADEESDKAAFKKLYAEFNDLYAGSTEIDVIIKSATNLKEMASRIFKKRSKEYAETIYILATLYDKKGDAINSDYERKAFELYDQYFNVYKKLKLPINQAYLEKYLAFVDTEYNIQLVRSKTKLSQNAIKLAQDIGLPNASIANIELDMAIKRYKINDTRYAKILLNSALNRYKHEYSKQHYKEGEILLWLGLVEAKKFNPGKANKNYISSIEIFDQFDPYELELHNNTHATLVELYEKLGRSDTATYHCKAIAVEQIENFDPYVNPLYIKIP